MLRQNIENNKNQGFDFTGNMTMLVDDIVKTHPLFKHIKTENILIAISRSSRNRNGILARVRPMLFEGGSRTKKVKGTQYIAPEIKINGSIV